jgi:hypothetical protein
MNVFRALATRSIVAGLGLIALTAAERPLQARQAEPLLQPTPLVLKDGRIASVAIHVVPFAPGRADLGGEAAARVAELTRAVGTDCFLTAQVIGHIDSSEVGQDDTLNAHRLARARADAVQASLIGGGLPAKAIASVWDWQFMVRAPRATLWIFQLTAGEDCEGRPLDGAMVAHAAPSTSRPACPAGARRGPGPGGQHGRHVGAGAGGAHLRAGAIRRAPGDRRERGAIPGARRDTQLHTGTPGAPGADGARHARRAAPAGEHRRREARVGTQVSDRRRRGRGTRQARRTRDHGRGSARAGGERLGHREAGRASPRAARRRNDGRGQAGAAGCQEPARR